MSRIVTLAFCAFIVVGFLFACDQRPSANASLAAHGFTESEIEAIGPEVLLQAVGENAEAQLTVANAYRHGHGIPIDTEKAIDWYVRAAEHGSIVAQRLLGHAYMDGTGIQEDVEEAARWFSQAANSGDRWSQYQLGRIYDPGAKRSPPSNDKSLEEIAQSDDDYASIAKILIEAEANNRARDAARNQPPRDIAKALHWYTMAAEQGNALAQHRVGEIYIQGHGVPTDPFAAAKWFTKSAEWGYSQSQESLGLMFLTGVGVPRDLTRASEWFERAAAQGELESQVMLAAMYWDGEGVPRDYVRAYAWANIAAARGREAAAQARDQLSASMTPSQIEEAQRISSSFHPRSEFARRMAGVGPADD